MIEKLGHTKRLQTMRKEWINEGKPRETLQTLGSGGGRSGTQHTGQTMSKPKIDWPSAAEPSERHQTHSAVSAIDADDDIYKATPKPAPWDLPNKRKETSKVSLFVSDEDGAGHEPPEDDLDALLAEDELKEATTTAALAAKAQKSPVVRDNFDDEMEAMGGMGGMDDMW